MSSNTSWLNLGNHLFAWALGIVSSLFLLSSAVFLSTWGLNDDPVMLMTATGQGFFGTPSEYLFFSHVFIGRILKAAYLHAASIPWYGYYTFTVLFISFVSLAYALLRFDPSPVRLGYFILYYCVIGLWVFRMPQFTLTSFFMGMSGVFLMAAEMHRKDAGPSFGVVCLGALLLLVASIIRHDSYLLALFLSAPLLSVGAGMNRARKKHLAGFLAVIIVTLIAAYYLQSYNSGCLAQSAGLRHSTEKQKLLVEFIDNNRVLEYSPRTIPILKSVGWSFNDLLMLLNWFSADDRVFGIDKMKIVLREFNALDVARPAVHFEYMLQDKYFFGLALLLVFFAVQIQGKSRRSVLFISVLAALGIILYLGHYVRLPDRVYLSIFSYLAFLSLYFAGTGERAIMPLRGWKTAFVAVLLIGSLFLHVNYNSVRQTQNALLTQSLRELKERSSDRLYVTWGDSIPLELLSVYDNLEGLAGMKILHLGIDFKDYRWEGLAGSFEVASFEELARKQNLFHIGKPYQMALFSRYLQEHYDMKIAYKLDTQNPFFVVAKTELIKPHMDLTPLSVQVEGVPYDIFLLK